MFRNVVIASLFALSANAGDLDLSIPLHGLGISQTIKELDGNSPASAFELGGLTLLQMVEHQDSPISADDLSTAAQYFHRFDAPFTVTISPDSLWFDLNGNGARDTGESLLDLNPDIDPRKNLVFTEQDRDWLRAQTDLVVLILQLSRYSLTND